jgi:hypothetical protein
MSTYKNCSERPKVGPRRATVRMYGEHHRLEIGLRSKFLQVLS